jgi:hypothetical protein
MVQDRCHALLLWYVDVQCRQHQSQRTGYNLNPNKSRPYGNKVENCLKLSVVLDTETCYEETMRLQAKLDLIHR